MIQPRELLYTIRTNSISMEIGWMIQILFYSYLMVFKSTVIVIVLIDIIYF